MSLWLISMVALKWHVTEYNGKTESTNANQKAQPHSLLPEKVATRIITDCNKDNH